MVLNLLDCITRSDPRQNNITHSKRISFEFQYHQRLGMKAKIPSINKRAQLSVRTDYDNTFRVTVAQLWNLLPQKLGIDDSLDNFKVGLGRFLDKYPDTQPVPGYTPVNDNSLLSWRRTLSKQST